MKISTLEYCIDIAKYKSFTRVAEQHYISQQALSQQIKSLEDELGVRLFERTRRSVEITLAGEAFVAEASEAIAHIRTAVSAAQACAQGYGGVLSIGINGPTSQRNISRLITAFVKDFPLVDIQLKVAPFSEIVADFQVNKAYDLLAIGNFEDFQSDEYCKRPCKTGQLMAVFSKNHPLAKNKDVTQHELLKELLICLSGSADGITERRKAFYRRVLGCDPPRIKVVENTETVNMLVSSGIGYTLLNSSLQDNYNTDRFAYVPIRGVVETHPNWLVWRRENSNPILPRLLEVADKIEL